MPINILHQTEMKTSHSSGLLTPITKLLRIAAGRMSVMTGSPWGPADELKPLMGGG